MKRRDLFLKSTAMTLASTGLISAPLSTLAASPTTPINVQAALLDLRIQSGPYKGAFEIAPNGLSNWYFTNLGLISVIQYLDAAALETYIRPYLDLYLNKVEPNLTIRDVNFPSGRANPSNFTLVLADSDDSYAATLLSLVVRYLRASQNWAWWDKNKTQLKGIAYLNIAVPCKPNGLSSVFQWPRNQTNNAGYLMDNAEVYRGLRDFTGLLADRGDTADANYFNLFATSMAAGMGELFSHATGGFRMADLASRTETSFYPGTTCQVFPQAFNVPELAVFYDSAWNFFNNNTPGWEKGSLDPYPWAVLGLVAAKRGQWALASGQVASIERTFIANRAMVTINELGFYQRTKSVMAGRPDI